MNAWLQKHPRLAGFIAVFVIVLIAVERIDALWSLTDRLLGVKLPALPDWLLPAGVVAALALLVGIIWQTRTPRPPPRQAAPLAGG